MSLTSTTTGSITKGTRVLKCPLLTAHNWTLWKHRMTNHLRAQQLWDVVDPTGSTKETASDMAPQDRGKTTIIRPSATSLELPPPVGLVFIPLLGVEELMF